MSVNDCFRLVAAGQVGAARWLLSPLPDLGRFTQRGVSIGQQPPLEQSRVDRAEARCVSDPRGRGVVDREPTQGLARLRHTPTTGSANGYVAISANMPVHFSLNFAGSIGLQPFHRGFCSP